MSRFPQWSWRLFHVTVSTVVVTFVVSDSTVVFMLKFPQQFRCLLNVSVSAVVLAFVHASISTTVLALLGFHNGRDAFSCLDFHGV